MNVKAKDLLPGDVIIARSGLSVLLIISVEPEICRSTFSRVLVSFIDFSSRFVADVSIDSLIDFDLVSRCHQ